MLKDIVLDANVFSPDYCDRASSKELKSLLEAISNSGYIVVPEGGHWDQQVFENVNALPPKIKERLMTVLKILVDRKRIVIQPVSNIDSEENDFHSNNEISLEDLEDVNIHDTFGITGSAQSAKTKDKMEEILFPFLSYARKLWIIDPYFYLESPRYQETLKIACRALRERRHHNHKARIEIHCKWNEDKRQHLELWRQQIFKFSDFYEHDIRVTLWQSKKGNYKMHDRYFITEQSGLVSASGTDRDVLQFSEWSIKDYTELHTVLSQYRINSSPFKLKGKVSASDITIN